MDGIFRSLVEELTENKPEWETRHDEFVKAGEEATPASITHLKDRLAQAEHYHGKQSDKKRTLLGRLSGGASAKDHAMWHFAARAHHRTISQYENAKHGTDDRKALGQAVVYAHSLLKRRKLD